MSAELILQNVPQGHALDGTESVFALQDGKFVQIPALSIALGVLQDQLSQIPGLLPQFREFSGGVQWQHTGDPSWQNLIPLGDIAGPVGDYVTLSVQNGYIVWKLSQGSVWNQLASHSSISGTNGANVQA